jgi:hypothetical protein
MFWDIFKKKATFWKPVCLNLFVKPCLMRPSLQQELLIITIAKMVLKFITYLKCSKFKIFLTVGESSSRFRIKFSKIKYFHNVQHLIKQCNVKISLFLFPDFCFGFLFQLTVEVITSCTIPWVLLQGPFNDNVCCFWY